LYALRNGVVLGNESVILVDDVITSGATMAECARVLKSAGAKDVIGVALARTVKLASGDMLTGDLFAEGNR
jgi:predicted amidophosphoribosyltransferase